MNLLDKYFSKLGYAFTAPNDGSIYFNSELLKGSNIVLVNKNRPAKWRFYLGKIIKIKSFEKYLKITFLSFLSNEIDIVFSFRFRFLIKEVKFCLGNRRKYKY